VTKRQAREPINWEKNEKNLRRRYVPSHCMSSLPKELLLLFSFFSQ